MRTQNPGFRLAATVAVTALLLPQVLPRSAMAQATPPPLRESVAPDQQGGDPPTRVGRLARLTGSVSFHAQDDEQWNPATLNFPVVQGNAFWTEPNAQAVIEISASRIAMAPGTELDVATLTDTAFQGTQSQGELYLRVRAATPDETYAVQTPRGLVTLTSPGRYGVVAGDTQSSTMVTVIEGTAHVEGPGVSLDIGASQMASVTGSDTFQGEVGPAQRDAFLMAMLAGERPQQPQGVAPPPVVAAMPGGDDLAEYGSWSDSPDYGQVWYPQVAQDWVPYREGRWAYVAPWGWTWVDSAPWGFAPFHYGRWVEAGGRWGWIPGVGVGVPRPVYAPALVTFLGVGAIAGIGIGAALAGGRVGWFPLGPREPFHPWYRASDRYFRQVNVTHVANFTTVNRNVAINNFVNRRAATVVPTSAMTASRPVGSSFQRVDPALLAQARPVLGQQPLRPAPTTVGVTPVVARQLGLPPLSPSMHTIAPGPTFRAAPTGVPTGVAPTALMGRQVLPTLHNPAQPNLPVAAGSVRPFTATPGLHAPAPGQIAPPDIRPEPGFAGQGAGSPMPPLVNRGNGGATPAIVSRESPQFQRAPGATFQQTTPPGILHAPTSPSVAGTPPPVVPRTPSPPVIANVPPAQVFHPPPPVVAHTPSPPVVANAPPAQVFRPPPPTVAHTPPPPVVANVPPAQVFHPPPPTVARAPPPVVANAPPAQVFRPPPPMVARTPPPPVMNAAPPVASAAPNPTPQFHGPPPQAASHAPPPPQQQNARQKRPGEP
jgi:Family of unknown function (DUF6600)